MKKCYLCYVMILMSTFVLNSCGGVGSGSSIPDVYIGKWDMTNDKSSCLQQTIELKEDGTFNEHWNAYNDEGDLIGELDIQGRFERPATEGYQKALCLIYDLESLNDENGILEAMEDEDYFKNNNDNYESAKKKGEVYGYQSAYVEGSRLRFKGGEWRLIDENLEKLHESSN